MNSTVKHFLQMVVGSDFGAMFGVGVCAFIICYLMSDRLLGWLHRRSLGQREQVLHYLELMFVETNRRKVTLMMLSASFGMGLLVVVILWPNVLAGLGAGSIVTVAMWSVPKAIVEYQWNRRCSLFVDQMIDGLTMMANGVKAGLSVQQCMERVFENMPNPISQEFGLVLSQMRLGRGLVDALADLGMRIPRPDVQMFVNSVSILQETGGNMGETFQTIVYVVRERQKIEKKIEAMTAQGMMQGTIVTLVPFAILLMFVAIDPNYIKPLYTTTLGVICLMAMLALQIAGGIAMRKIVRIKV